MSKFYKLCLVCSEKVVTSRDYCTVCGSELIAMKSVNLLESIFQTYTYDTVDESKVFGIDVHQYSGVVDWKKAREAGVKFALIKATSGVLVSNYFRQNWEGAAKEGILRGSWHWLFNSFDISAGRQARFVAETLKADPGELPMFCDFEWTKYNGKQSNPDTGSLYGFLAPYEDLMGKTAGIYTSIGYWNQYGNKGVTWKKYPLWVANYKVTTPSIPLPFTEHMFWQFSENVEGAKYGVDKYAERAVDGDYFNGTLQELYALASQPAPEPNPIPLPTPVPEEDPIVEVQVKRKSGKVNIIR